MRIPRPLEQVVAGFAARCEAHSGGFAGRAKRVDADAPPGLLDGVLRLEGRDAAMVACLDLGPRDLSAEEFLARLERVADSMDLAELGGIRMVRLERAGEGTFAVAIWSQGSLALPRMFPQQGDAPGADPRHVPRAPGSRRVLSLWQEGRAPAVNAYLAPQGVDEALAFYRERLPRAGWKLADGVPEGALVATRGDAMAVWHIEPDAAGSRILVLPVDMRAAHVSPAH